MLTLCQTEGHFFIHTAHTTSWTCTYCSALRTPFTRESEASKAAALLLSDPSIKPIMSVHIPNFSV